jgi:hypothetical protein
MRSHRQNHSVAASLIVSGIALCSAASAQAPSGGKLEQKFQAADTNHDGKLTLEEAKAGMPRVAKTSTELMWTRRGTSRWTSCRRS